MFLNETKLDLSVLNSETESNLSLIYKLWDSCEQLKSFLRIQRKYISVANKMYFLKCQQTVFTGMFIKNNNNAKTNCVDTEKVMFSIPTDIYFVNFVFSGVTAEHQFSTEHHRQHERQGWESETDQQGHESEQPDQRNRLQIRQNGSQNKGMWLHQSHVILFKWIILC